MIRNCKYVQQEAVYCSRTLVVNFPNLRWTNSSNAALTYKSVRVSAFRVLVFNSTMGVGRIFSRGDNHKMKFYQLKTNKKIFF